MEVEPLDPIFKLLLNSIFLSDVDTGLHSFSTANYMLEIAGKLGLSETDCKVMYYGALLHDLGKTRIPRWVLQKPGPLTEQEWQVVQRHPEISYQILYPIRKLRSFVDIPYCHHEHWDGTGYPRQLKGEEIPFPARLFAIVDLWDALKSDRVYRRAWDVEKITLYLQEQAGKQLDPWVVTYILPLISEIDVQPISERLSEN